MSDPNVSAVETGQAVTANLFRRITAVVVVLVVLAAVYAGPEQIPFKDFSADFVTQLITAAILVALFIERTIEVILNAWRGQTKARLERELKERRQVHVAAEGKQPKPAGNPAAAGEAGGEAKPAAVKEAEIEVAPDVVIARDALDSYRAENGRIALLLGLILGIIASALGIRLIAPLLDPQVSDELTRNHHRFLIGLDVLITGALLGGGANGLHSVLDLFLKHVNGRRDSIREAANRATQ